MREIIFRGKRSDTGEWVNGSFVQMLVDGRIVSCIAPIEEVGRVGRANKDVPPMGILFTLNKGIFIVNPATVGQYTGLTDKNGNKIFYGDICQFNYEPHLEYNNPKLYSVTAIVEWPESGCGFVLHNVQPRSKSHPSRKQYFKMGDYRINGLTIIGNVHDNPNLLKGGNQ